MNVLDPDSYTVHRLKHANASHLHATTHRFFIGPIPEGWLNSNRKSWYKRRIALTTGTNRRASFTAAADQGTHRRTLTGLGGPSTAARMSFSFPQPDDVFDRASESETSHMEGETDEDEAQEDTDTDIEVETTAIEPVATDDILPTSSVDDTSKDNVSQPNEPVRSAHALTIPDGKMQSKRIKTKPSLAKSPTRESYQTAQEHIEDNSRQNTPVIQPVRGGSSLGREESNEPRSSVSYPEGSFRQSEGDQPSDTIDASSRTALLQPATSQQLTNSPKSALKSMQHHEPSPLAHDDGHKKATRGKTGVRFKVSEGITQGQARLGRKYGSARDRASEKKRRAFRRNTLQEGTIIKMERMLVKVDVTLQSVSDNYNENESLRTETRPIEKWREFMVVARKSKSDQAEDFRLQFYQTRVIPAIEDEKTKKKPAREIKLDLTTAHVNLYSPLDKTLVIWHPYKKGTRMFVMKPTSSAHSVEWYSFLKDALGHRRPDTLIVNVPDLDVQLKIERPFAELEIAARNITSQTALLARTIEVEQAVAGKIISQCTKILEGDPEWIDVLKSWNENEKIGLAWKRYDRLEWIHGQNEKKMYGTMAMQHTHDLELRPKYHYPTTAHGKKGKLHEEPPPIEGFLVRLTSQKGAHQRMTRAFFKRLYFATHNQFLFFNRPAKATPPHPPRLATISGSNIPTSREIVEKTPVMFEIEPFKCHHNEVTWLASGDPDSVLRHDEEAYEESMRNLANIAAADGYIDMCQVVKVRPLTWGASPADEALEPGSESDIDFHEDVSDTRQDDGSTKEIDDGRTFELVLVNGLVIRLQAYDKETCKEWMKRMKQLVKYWKKRVASDLETFRAVRHSNLVSLNIGEEQEANVGQFARKWELSRSSASPELYNMCTISNCRPITMSGHLYRKARRHATFQRCSVMLTGGQLLLFQADVRKTTGEQVKHIHQEKLMAVDLKDCYVYAGLIVEEDLLYQNRTFDANHPSGASLPRVFPEDGYTSSDMDVMTCFVIWMNQRKSWFRSVIKPDTVEPLSIPPPPSRNPSSTSFRNSIATEPSSSKDTSKGSTRARLKRVGQLGVPGRGMVFKCRSRAERDRWVLSVASEIDQLVEAQIYELGEEGDVRFDT